MQESGVIKKIEEKTMLVEFERSSMCEKCGACERGQQNMLMEVARIEEAEIGDRVMVALPEEKVIEAALIAYGIPLLLLLLGLFAGNYLPAWLGISINADLCAVICGLLFAAIAFLAVHLTEKKRRDSGKFAPRVIALEK